MPAYELLLKHVTPFMLVAARLAGLFVFTPLLSNKSLPRRFRVMLAVMLAAAIYPVLPTAAQIEPAIDLAGLLPMTVSELLIGITIGFLAGLPVIALDMSGFLIGHQMGMNLARVYNPDAGTETDVFGQVLMYIGIATFLALGGLEAAFGTLVSTFRNVPIGGFAVDRTPIQMIVGVVSSGVELAVRVAAPVICIIFLLLIAMGFVMKTMPQVNVMSVGFTVKILFGIGMLAASLVAMQHATSDEIDRVLRVVVDWGRSLA
jgi:flagellar biosynthetic protein FliR